MSRTDMEYMTSICYLCLFTLKTHVDIQFAVIQKFILSERRYQRLPLKRKGSHIDDFTSDYNIISVPPFTIPFTYQHVMITGTIIETSWFHKGDDYTIQVLLKVALVKYFVITQFNGIHKIR